MTIHEVDEDLPEREMPFSCSMCSRRDGWKVARVGAAEGWKVLRYKTLGDLMACPTCVPVPKVSGHASK